MGDGIRERFQTRDVSAGGVFLSVSSPLALFSEVQLLLQRSRDEPCWVPARVVHVVSDAKASLLKIPAGMGLQFEPANELHEEAIACLVREAQSLDPRRRVPRLVSGANVRDLADPMLAYVAAQVDGVRRPEAIAESLELELEATEGFLRELARAGVIELLAPALSDDARIPSDRAAPGAQSNERVASKLAPVVRARLEGLSGLIDDADHYAVLGVAPDATRQALNGAYLELSRALHPDAHIGRVGAEDLAQLERAYGRILEAYAVLSRPGSRSEFDEYMDRRRGLSVAPPNGEPTAERELLEQCLAEVERAHREGRSSEAERWVGRLRGLTVGPEDRARVDRVCQLVLTALADEYEKQAVYEERHQRWSDATQSWSRVADWRPRDPEPWRRAALAVIASERDAQRAVELARRAIELAPDDPHSRRVLGHAYLAAGMQSSAREELEAAVRLGQG